MAIVYLHLRKDNRQPFYVGIGVKESRAFVKDRRSNHWQRVVNKYGLIVEVLCYNISYHNACDIEKHIIKFYGRKDNGTGILVNKTNGGEGSLGIIVSESTREKLRQKNLQRIYKPHSEEARLKNRLAHLGIKTVPCSAEKKLKLRISNLGTKRRPCTEEEKEVKRIKSTGKKLPESAKEKVREARSQSIHQIDSLQNFIKEWPSAKFAAKKLEVPYYTLRRRLNTNKLYLNSYWKIA